MNSSSALSFFLILASFLCWPARGQQPQPAAASEGTSQALPADPAAILQLASQVNGLHGADLKPWHVRATWRTLDDNRQPQEQGTWEEWWAGEKKFRMAYKSADVDRTIYETEHGRYEVGAAGRVPWQFATVERLISGPVQMIKATPSLKPVLSRTEMQQGTVQLSCVLQDMAAANGTPIEVRRPDGTSRQLEARDCFSGDLPAIRAQAMSQGSQTVFNSVVRFQGKYLAKTIRYVGAGGVETDISVETVEPIDPVVDSDFVPPAGAVVTPENRTVAVNAGMMAGNRVDGKQPQYPRDALAARVQGTVVLKARILADGNIGDLSVISGPPMLLQAAVDAVKTWRYRPYMLNGQAVEVLTQINVVFRLGS